MAADLNFDRALAAGELAIDHLSDDFNTERVARLVITAALPHILDTVARPFDVDDPHAMIYMSEAASVIRGSGENHAPDGLSATYSPDPASVVAQEASGASGESRAASGPTSCVDGA